MNDLTPAQRAQLDGIAMKYLSRESFTSAIPSWAKPLLPDRVEELRKKYGPSRESVPMLPPYNA